MSDVAGKKNRWLRVLREIEVVIWVKEQDFHIDFYRLARLIKQFFSKGEVFIKLLAHTYALAPLSGE